MRPGYNAKVSHMGWSLTEERIAVIDISDNEKNG